MEGNGKKLLDYIRKHFAGIGVVLVALAMIFTVVAEVAGKEREFDPNEIELLSSSEFFGIPDRTGYDLSGEGEEGEEVSRESDSDQDKEKDEEDEESAELDESEVLQANEGDPIILPDGMADRSEADDAIDVALKPNTGGSGNVFGTAPGSNQDDSSEENYGSSSRRPEQPDRDKEEPGENGSGDPLGGDKTDPPGEGDDNPGGTEEEKFFVIIGDKKWEFDSEDDALAWVADHEGTNDVGHYFEGFTKDENGNLIPSYTDKDQFDGNSKGDVAYDYTGSSGVFVVPEGSTSLDLFKSNNNVKIIVIPKAVDNIVIGDGVTGCGFTILEKFIVSEDNTSYISVDGILYKRTDEGSLKLEAVPAAKKEIEKWPDNLTCVGENSFYQSSIEVVKLPDTVSTIENQAFNGSSVGTIILPESVKTIGSFAFFYADPAKGEEPSLHKIIVKSKEPPQVSNATFYWMDYQLENHLGDPCTQIMVPDSSDDSVYEAYLMSWGMALAKRYGGDAALQILNTKNGAQNRYEYYDKCGQKGFKKIGEPIVYQDDSLGRYRTDEEENKVLVECIAETELVDLSDSGIVSIDEGAFDGCSAMTIIKLPESLQVMPENLFEKNEDLKIIISYASDPPAAAIGVSSDCAVFVRPDALAGYQSAWSGQVRKILGTSDTYTATAAGLVFDTGSTRLIDVPADMTSLTIPSYVRTIYDGAAAGNGSLGSVTIPATVKNVGEGAFSDCSGLSSAAWYTSASVSASCFEGCTQLRTFSAANSNTDGHRITEIGDRAFYGCQSLGTVLYYTYPSGGTNYYYYYCLERIGEEAFYGCTSMTYAYLHPSVTSVGRSAFEGSGLTQAYWYTSTSVPVSCFEGCTQLRTFSAANSNTDGHRITEIEDRAFYGCQSLGTVLYYTYPSGGIDYYYYYCLERIGEEAFYGCTSMTYAYLHPSVTSVGRSAFEGSGLTQVYWYTSASVPDSCFDGRSSSGLTLTFTANIPPAWSGTDAVDALTIYVPDSEENNDEIYRAYLNAWSSWLGEHPEDILKTNDGAENRVFSDEEGIAEIREEEDSILPEETEPEETNPEETEEETDFKEEEKEEIDSEETDPEGTDPEGTDSEETEKGEPDPGKTDPEENGEEEEASSDEEELKGDDH